MLGSAVPVASPPNSLSIPSLLNGGVGWEAEKDLTLCKFSSAISKTSLCYQHCPQNQRKTQPNTDNEHYFGLNQYKPEVLPKQLESLTNQDEVLWSPGVVGNPKYYCIPVAKPFWKASYVIFPLSPYAVSDGGHHLRRGWHLPIWVTLGSPFLPEI